jgi:hypothetical protein
MTDTAPSLLPASMLEDILARAHDVVRETVERPIADHLGNPNTAAETEGPS